MTSEKHNTPDQEISIKARGREVFDKDIPVCKLLKPFRDYLRETPAEPFCRVTNAILWTVGTIVTLLFLAAVLRTSLG